jgi:hypothetical protein
MARQIGGFYEELPTWVTPRVPYRRALYRPAPYRRQLRPGP